MLSHLDSRNQPQMVDVSAKQPTDRTAAALAVVTLPAELAERIADNEIASAKGPVFQTAILAGIQGAKRTSDLIPLCHPLPLDRCQVTVDAGAPGADGRVEVRIVCRVSTHARTGVEMEALTGASTAALALYDMGKGVSHEIVIGPIRLLEKTGGRRPFVSKP